MGKIVWSEKEIELLRKYYADAIGREICDKIPTKTFAQIMAKSSNLGLLKTIQKHRWTTEMIATLRKLHPVHSNKEVARMMGLTDDQVGSKAFVLRLKKSPKYLAQLQIETNKFMATLGKETCYKKGRVSENKGKKIEEWMSPEHLANFRKTMFKKGSIPVNAKRVGSIRVSKEGFYEIRVPEVDLKRHSAFRFLHREIWIKRNGPVPKGHIVGFVDFNKRNFDPDNLKLYSWAENMKRIMLSENCIARKNFKIDQENVDEFIRENPILIELKKKELTMNSKINERRRENNR